MRPDLGKQMLKVEKTLWLTPCLRERRPQGGERRELATMPPTYQALKKLHQPPPPNNLKFVLIQKSSSECL